MQIRSVREADISQIQKDARVLVVGCGYEHRSQGITSVLGVLPQHKLALCYTEFPDIIARQENEEFFRERGFSLEHLSANSPSSVRNIISSVVQETAPVGGTIAFDISTMTRAWHGAIIRQFRIEKQHCELRTLFAYVPSVYQPPPSRRAPNEFVAPVEGFTSLGTPDLPVAAIIGLGYEREGALGLQQLIDPQLTILLVAKEEKGPDPFYDMVVHNNKDVLKRTSAEWIFEYDLSEPASTFSTLASIVGGLAGKYRIVVASLGPKIFGVLCFLLATRYSDISVWRISSGVHAQPRDSFADLDRVVVLDVLWQPN